MEENLEKLKYPTGKYSPPAEVTQEKRNAWIQQIAELPAELSALVAQLDEKTLSTQYRPGGWTAKQVIHHIADSHMNALIRFKLALTENNPTIKPYAEAEWALLADYQLNIKLSVDMIRIIHEKWIAILNNMGEADFSRTFFHPANNRTQTLGALLSLYAWHGQHHLAHIKNCLVQEA